MRQADIFMHGIHAGILEKFEPGGTYRFTYDPNYQGPVVSLTLPVRPDPYEFNAFPPFLEGLLPEGYNLEALLRARKIDRRDFFGQLLAVGEDMVGALTVRETE
jgi:serine/threonine-protein kinase HipA